MGETMSMENDIIRIRDELTELHAKNLEYEKRIATVEERGDRREADMTRIEQGTEKALSKLEGMIQSLSAQISTLQNAPAHKLATRWDDIVKSVLSWGAVAALGALAMRLWG
jgi:predicted  nucleic acid-binding Zn-ribbon protein